MPDDPPDFNEERLTDRTRFTCDSCGTYDSLDYHRTRMTVERDKTLWSPAVPRQEEFEVFRRSKRSNWECQNGHLWGLGEDKDGKQILGDGDERLACFPKRSNDTDPFHGYPCAAAKGSPPVDLVRKWNNWGVITNSFKKKILREKI